MIGAPNAVGESRDVEREREDVKATAFEFRFRQIFIAGILVLGFWSPWVHFLHVGTLTTAWLWLGFEAGEMGMTATAAIRAVTAGLVVSAGLAAFLRVWGTAYLGPETVNKQAMVSDGRGIADGPFRYMRNPLYLGTWLMAVAIAGLMPVSGAGVTLVLLAMFLFRLILGEENFLRAKEGAAYKVYVRAVPRLLPLPGRRVVAQGRPAAWGRALLGEVMPLGVFASFAVLSWQYNAMLLVKAVVISFGVSLVVRAALIPPGGAQRS